MKLNEDCMRDILKLLVKELKLFIDQKYHIIQFGKLSLMDISNEMTQYDLNDICQCAYILCQNGYIKGDGLFDINGKSASKIYVNEVTYIGYQLFESIQPEPIWNKTKSVLKQVGVHSLKFIETVAHDVAVESAKQAVSVMISQQQTP